MACAAYAQVNDRIIKDFMSHNVTRSLDRHQQQQRRQQPNVLFRHRLKAISIENWESYAYRLRAEHRKKNAQAIKRIETKSFFWRQPIFRHELCLCLRPSSIYPNFSFSIRMKSCISKLIIDRSAPACHQRTKTRRKSIFTLLTTSVIDAIEGEHVTASI